MWVATHIFSAKNIRILYIEFAKTVNEMTLNELVKLTTLWTTGPRFLTLPGTRGTLRQRRLLCACMYLYSLAFMEHPCTLGAAVCHQALPCPLYTQPRAHRVWVGRTNGLKVVSTRAGYSYSLQIFNAARQLSHIEVAPDKFGLVLLDYWVGLKRCLVIIHN